MDHPFSFGQSEIGNQEIWDLEIGRFLHLKAEIINLRLDEEFG